MEITQSFYDGLAPCYDRLFSDWEAATREQADILCRLFSSCGISPGARVLDCACGIGTQAIGLAALGYALTASDLSGEALRQARERAGKRGVRIRFEQADFRALSRSFPEEYDIVMAMDNALPHMLCAADLETAVREMAGRVRKGGLLAASIRDYDALLAQRPPYSPPYIHKTDRGRRVAFQTWDWQGRNYRLIQYLIEDEGAPEVRRFECEYRAVLREELTALLLDAGCRRVDWKFPEETGFYQPVVLAMR